MCYEWKSKITTRLQWQNIFSSSQITFNLSQFWMQQKMKELRDFSHLCSEHTLLTFNFFKLNSKSGGNNRVYVVGSWPAALDLRPFDSCISTTDTENPDYSDRSFLVTSPRPKHFLLHSKCVGKFFCLLSSLAEKCGSDRKNEWTNSEAATHTNTWSILIRCAASVVQLVCLPVHFAACIQHRFTHTHTHACIYTRLQVTA